MTWFTPARLILSSTFTSPWNAGTAALLVPANSGAVVYSVLVRGTGTVLFTRSAAAPWLSRSFSNVEPLM